MKDFPDHEKTKNDINTVDVPVNGGINRLKTLDK